VPLIIIQRRICSASAGAAVLLFVLLVLLLRVVCNHKTTHCEGASWLHAARFCQVRAVPQWPSSRRHPWALRPVSHGSAIPAPGDERCWPTARPTRLALLGALSLTLRACRCEEDLLLPAWHHGRERSLDVALLMLRSKDAGGQITTRAKRPQWAATSHRSQSQCTRSLE
jgi:hypothetical protein